MPVKTSFKKKFTSTTKASAKSDESSDRPWFCSLFNWNKCLHKSDHTLVSCNGQMKYALHICATCYQMKSCSPTKIILNISLYIYVQTPYYVD